jgi:uncharacterized protein YjbJ (UPF0337 family)
MNTLLIKGNWNILKGKFRQTVGELIEDENVYVEGLREEKLGVKQNHIGRSQDEFRRKLMREFGAF